MRPHIIFSLPHTRGFTDTEVRVGVCRWHAQQSASDSLVRVITNNASERALRPAALGRKNYLFAGSDEGGRTTAVLYSLTQTCRRHSIDPFAYLRDVLTRLPQSDFQNLADLFPHRWAQSQRATLDTPA